jgi:putative nucleotidyltransferase with HDIG domain
MSSGNQKRTRSEHVAQLELPPSRVTRAISLLRRGDVTLRILLCVLAALLIWVFTAGWSIRLPYRTGMTPERDIIARQTFERDDEEQTAAARESARRSVECVYDHDVQRVNELRQRLKDRILHLISAPSFAELDAAVWQEFLPPQPAGTTERKPEQTDTAVDAAQSESIYQKLVAALADDPELEKFEQSIERLFEPISRFGVLEKIQHGLDDGSQSEICVRRSTDNKREHRVEIDKVRRSETLTAFDERLKEVFAEPVLQIHVGYWLKSLMPNTLTINTQLTNVETVRIVDAVETVRVPYEAGKTRLAEGGKPLSAEKIELLRLEHQAWLDNRPWNQRVWKAAGDFGMYTALYLLCGAYLFYRRHDLLRDYRRLITLQAVVVVTVVTACFTARDSWQAELIPLMLFGITVALCYRQELALLLSASVCLIVVLTIRQGLTEFVVLTACLAATILMLRRIRTRTKLIYVGLAAGVVAMLTTIGVGVVSGATVDTHLLVKATWYGFCAILSSVLMTGLLPFIERLLDVQTDISLLELGDVAHPLLQELVRRAPGTYNHSINVASIAESAAESIGGNGLLVRVGAYFHDIGKMLKPQYFIENQTDSNRHESLLPAMSTLILIAHVKDGADLARQHHLPQSIIDFILQHHGTTLVEYFYSQASKQCEDDPDASAVDEGSFRYPGPRPQTREAAVLMLADSVESASRSLQDPAPARIESLVNELAMKRLLDGQFDQCGLTLKELRTVQDSLIKSLTAMYHSRVKYPDQQTA